MSAERGRPRSFDTEQALERALEVFWRHGFQGASLSELTEAMGLSKPSLYAAFGDKEELYLKALDRYLTGRVAQHVSFLDTEPNGRLAVEGFLRSMAKMLTDISLPGGCFIVNGTADCGGTLMPATIEAALRNAQQKSEAKLQERILRAQQEGQLAQDAEVENLAAFFFSLLAGIAVLAKSGAELDKLNNVVNTAMNIWPEPRSGQDSC